MIRRLLIVFAATAMLFALSSPLAASAESAADGEVGATLAWPCSDGSSPSETDSGGYDTWASCQLNNWYFSGYFQAHGEIVTVCDKYPNDKRTIVDVQVTGYSSVTLDSRGATWDKPCVRHNLSYPEGLKVWIFVCSRNDGNGQCHAGYGGRT